MVSGEAHDCGGGEVVACTSALAGSDGAKFRTFDCLCYDNTAMTRQFAMFLLELIEPQQTAMSKSGPQQAVALCSHNV